MVVLLQGHEIRPPRVNSLFVIQALVIIMITMMLRMIRAQDRGVALLAWQLRKCSCKVMSSLVLERWCVLDSGWGRRL